jgi:dihydropteroate synthase
MRYTIRALDIKNRQEGLSEFAAIGSTLPGQNIMVEKIFPLAIKVDGLKLPAINILKQEMLARGGDVVTSRDILLENEGIAEVIIEGTWKSFEGLIQKLKIQPFGLKDLSRELEEFLANHRKIKAGFKYTISGRKLNTSEVPLVMGILNFTPDSFFDGGKYDDRKSAEKQIGKMVKDGADIIDVGGMSSRPGSKPVSIEEELKRVIPVIEYINDKHDVLVSVDTYRSEVARKAVAAGANIINDISALTMDKDMAKTAADCGASIVLMHMQGTPEDMQDNPQYDNVLDDIYAYLEKQAGLAVEAGIPEDRIIIDPGIGFGKTLGHNLNILNKLREFTYMGFPVLIGASRKSFIGKIMELDADQRLEGSLAAAVWSTINGASILRVHDVKETKRAISVAASIMFGYK